MRSRDKKLRFPPRCDAAPDRALTPDQIEADYTTVDCLARYLVEHLEDGASADNAVRRRYGRLVGLLAEYAEGAYARLRGR